MRIKNLLSYYFMTLSRAVIIFFSIYMAGTLLTSIFSASGTVSVGFSFSDDGSVNSWSISIFAFLIFIIVVFLTTSQNDTRFLITRSVSRKEIFFATSVALVILSAVMSLLQILSIYIDASIRSLSSGESFRGLELDVQALMAPNMTNVFVFFIVSFLMMTLFGALSYLIGSCLARWKIITIGVLSITFIAFFGLFYLEEFFKAIVDIFKFMFSDKENALILAVKYIAVSCIILLISFPVMRRITAAKHED